MKILMPLVIGPEAQATIDARLEQHKSAKRLYGKVMAKDSGAGQLQPGDMVDAGKPPARQTLHYSPSEDCAWLSQDGDGLCATHRRACEECGRSEGLHAGDPSLTKCGPNEAPIVEMWCAHCDPPVGEMYADGQPDPWSLADEELVTSADLPREVPAYWGRARDEYDANDDKQDIQPFGRTTK